MPLRPLEGVVVSEKPSLGLERGEPAAAIALESDCGCFRNISWPVVELAQPVFAPKHHCLPPPQLCSGGVALISFPAFPR